VFLTGMPHPNTALASVEVYVLEIAASTQADTVGGRSDWNILATPRRRFDLLQLLGSSMELAGVAKIPTDLYYAVRLTVDSDSSAVTFGDGTAAKIGWPSDGHFSAYASLERPISVPDSGTSIVIDFDLEQSLFGGLGAPLFDFLLSPVMRAVDSTETGAIHGTVLGDTDGDGFADPVSDAWVSVFEADSAWRPEKLFKRSAGRTDSSGYYWTGFLNPGSYTVEITTPAIETFGPLVAHDVEVVAGEEFTFSVTLPIGSVAGIFSWR
jgi:hypothetical protein